MIDQIIIIDDHPKHKDHLVIDQTMILDDHQKHKMPTSWLISPALSPDMHDRDLWENFEVSLKVLNNKNDQLCPTLLKSKIFVSTHQRHHCFLRRETDLVVNVVEKF